MLDIPPHRLSRAVFHQTRPRNGLLDVADPARYDARYHRARASGAWYASFTERGAWAELFRHWDQDEISPFEMRRRVGRVGVVDLDVIDLTDPAVRAALSVTEDELVSNDWSRCQQIADEARAAGFDGILAPSAALEGETTLVVFPGAMHKLTPEHSRVQRPPIRMVDVLTRIRLPDAAMEVVGRLYEALAALARRTGRR